MQQVFSINRGKAEAPVTATFFVIGLLGSIMFYPTFRWYAFLLFPLLALIYLLFRAVKLSFFKRQCFIFLDDEGIRYCLHVYMRPVFIAWNQIDRINYQMYEINIKLKESGLVICIPTGYLKNPDDREELKKLLDAKMI